MGVSCAGFGWLFFLAEVLVVDDAGGDSDGLEAEILSGTGVAGAGSDANSEADTETGSGSFVGEAVAELVSPAFEGAFINFGMIIGLGLDRTWIFPFSHLG